MARSMRAPADPGREDRKTMAVLVGIAAVLAVLVLGLGAWLQYGGKPARSVTVAIAPLKDEIEPLAPPPHPAAAGTGAGQGAGTAVAPASNPAAAPADQPAPADKNAAAPATTASNGTLILKPSPINTTGTGGEHALSPAPDPGLIERGKYGFEPVVGHDGRAPWQVYARPFPLSDPRPRIAIIVTSLGLGSTATDAAINKLPANVTLAFAPFSRRISEWTNLARLGGHEVLLELPMEPIDYPRQDPGYNALLTANSTEQNLDRLNWTLSQTVGYVGLIGRLGSRFQAARDSLAPVLADIAQRGLLFVDNRTAPQSAAPALAATDKLPYAAASRVVDAQADGSMIVRNLADLEDIARRSHVAVGLVSATPGTIDRIATWAAGLPARGIALAPVSALAAVPPPPANTANASDQATPDAAVPAVAPPAGATTPANTPPAGVAPASAKAPAVTTPAGATP